METNQLYITNPDEVAKLEDQSSSEGDQIGFAFELFIDAESVRNLALRMVVDVNGDQENWEDAHRYKAQISVVGSFRFQDERESRPPADQLSTFFLRSSISMLYGIIRTRLADATSGQPYSPLVLPTMDFSPIIERVEFDEEELDRFEQLAPPTE